MTLGFNNKDGWSRVLARNQPAGWTLLVAERELILRFTSSGLSKSHVHVGVMGLHFALKGV